RVCGVQRVWCAVCGVQRVRCSAGAVFSGCGVQRMLSSRRLWSVLQLLGVLSRPTRALRERGREGGASPAPWQRLIQRGRKYSITFFDAYKCVYQIAVPE
ncbi:hypothetical protein ANANG_G00073380, partial [Anguilla anguilla]